MASLLPPMISESVSLQEYDTTLGHFQDNNLLGRTQLLGKRLNSYASSVGKHRACSEEATAHMTVLDTDMDLNILSDTDSNPSAFVEADFGDFERSCGDLVALPERISHHSHHSPTLAFTRPLYSSGQLRLKEGCEVESCDRQSSSEKCDQDMFLFNF